MECPQYVFAIIDFLKKFKDVFAWTYKNLKGIPREITKYRIKLDIFDC